MTVKVINESKHPLPEYATRFSAGLDLRANLDNDITIEPLERELIPTGLKVQLPEGFEFQIRPRSGLSLKEGITAILGTIDADYRGEIGVIIANLSNKTITIKDGERIAQIVLNRVYNTKWVETDTLDPSERSGGGFGSTGK